MLLINMKYLYKLNLFFFIFTKGRIAAKRRGMTTYFTEHFVCLFVFKIIKYIVPLFFFDTLYIKQLLKH